MSALLLFGRRFRASSEGGGSGDWVWRGFSGRVAFRISGGPEGCVPRRLFDNFIGRKRDVDGGVLAGFVGFSRPGEPEETS